MEEGSWHCCHSLLGLQRLCACFLAPQSPCLTDLSLCLHFYELLGEAGGAERQQYIPVQRGDIVPRTGNKGGSVLSEFTAGDKQGFTNGPPANSVYCQLLTARSCVQDTAIQTPQLSPIDPPCAAWECSCCSPRPAWEKMLILMLIPLEQEQEPLPEWHLSLLITQLSRGKRSIPSVLTPAVL